MDIGVDGPIFTQKTSKALWDNYIYALQYGIKLLWQFFIFMELYPIPHYFMITKTLILSEEK